jgi:phage shock protein A
MAILSRLSDIVTANVHALLDRIENPELLSAQVIREMEKSLAAARRYGATAIAAERALARELAQHREEVERWQIRAREALTAGRDDLARRALVRKKAHADLARSLEAQHVIAQQTSERVRDGLHELARRLTDARQRQRAFIARHRAVRVQQELEQVMEPFVPALDGSAGKLDRLENRLRQWEDELAARQEIDQALGGSAAEFVELKTSQTIDEDLLALKQEVRPG